jgi:hypothetical protein
VTLPLVTVIPPLATVRPLLTVAPAFKKAAPVVVRVLLTAVGRAKTTCVGDIVFPPQLKVPLPLCVRLPFTFTVERKMLDGKEKLPPPLFGTGTHWPNIWMALILFRTLSGSPTERIQSVPAETPISCLMGTPGVVRGRAESVVKNTLLTAAPIVLNWSCVEPFIVWNTLESTPPEVRPDTRAVIPVARAAPPKTAPRP